MTDAIAVSGLVQSVGGMPLFRGLSLTIRAGDIVAIVGPNGCGKSTLLDLLAGILPLDGGSVTLNRGLGFSYVFQDYRASLFPWRTVRGNLSFPLEIRGMSRQAIAACIESMLRDFPLEFPLDRYPLSLSGGQQQIVVLLRSLLTSPSLLLLDEAFSALDEEQRLRVRLFLLSYAAQRRPTILFVSHDIDEAVHLAHRVVVLSQRPTAVAASIEMDLPHRALSILEHPSFLRARSRVLHAFRCVTKL